MKYKQSQSEKSRVYSDYINYIIIIIFKERHIFQNIVSSYVSSLDSSSSGGNSNFTPYIMCLDEALLFIL